MEKHAPKILSSLKNIVKDYDNSNTNRYFYKLYRNTCITLGDLEVSHQYSKPAFEEIQKILKENRNLDVITSCIQVAGQFIKNKDIAGKTLASLLSKYLEKPVSLTSISLIRSLIHAIGEIQEEKAYVPLMLVLQSGYPERIKRDAYDALDKLQLDR